MNLSIIIPTHNRANQLFNVLKSISKLLDETSFEVIVVDNNSNDKTYQVVKSYVSFAKYFFEESTAFTKARMTGAQNATGKFLLYLLISPTLILIPSELYVTVIISYVFL